MWQLDAGRGRPLVNQPLFDLRGRLLGYPDLFDPDAGVVGEYDGADHRSAQRHSDDVDRESGFRDHLLEVVRFTGPDMNAPQRVTERIRAAYARARWVAPARRTWTLVPPAHWSPALSRDARLARRSLDTAS